VSRNLQTRLILKKKIYQCHYCRASAGASAGATSGTAAGALEANELLVKYTGAAARVAFGVDTLNAPGHDSDDSSNISINSDSLHNSPKTPLLESLSDSDSGKEVEATFWVDDSTKERCSVVFLSVSDVGTFYIMVDNHNVEHQVQLKRVTQKGNFYFYNSKLSRSIKYTLNNMESLFHCPYDVHLSKSMETAEDIRDFEFQKHATSTEPSMDENEKDLWITDFFALNEARKPIGGFNKKTKFLAGFLLFLPSGGY